VEEFLSDTYGPNYFGWRHPLSPYFDTAAGGFAAVKADDITCHYRDWLSVWGGRERQYPSEIVVTWRNRVNRLRAEAKNIPTFVDAFGFVFKQAQPRAWTEIIAPLFVMEDDKYTRFLLTVKWLIDGAEEASRALRTQIKVARFAVRDSEGTYKFTDSQRSTETGDNQVELFWRVTETRFRNILNNLAGLPDPSDEDQRIRKNWLNYIRREALRIFDEDIAPNEAWSEDPKRLVYARSSLTNAFIENNKVWKALGLPPPLKTKKNGRKVDGEAARP
jgi:CRISPR type I-E-associated protein CasA/Cse1